MKRHWRENGPPVYISVAGFLGYKPPADSGDEDFIEDPELLAMALSSFPGGRVIRG